MKNFTLFFVFCFIILGITIAEGQCFITVVGRLYLEGPYTGGVMSNSLTVPTTNPCGGNDATANMSTVVDWVEIELRDEFNNTSIIATRCGLLLTDGSFVDIDGISPLTFDGLSDGNYYVAVHHRNHLSIITDAAVASTGFIDFSTGIGIFGTNPQKDVGGGIFAMWAGDANDDGFINAADRAETWNNRNTSGYILPDVTLDKFCNAADRATTWNNRNKGEQIPLP